MPRDPRRRREGEPVAADRDRPGRRTGGAPEGSSLHLVPPRPRVLPVLLPRRGGGGCVRGGHRSGIARGGGGRRLRPRAGRRQQPAQSGDRRPGLLERPRDRGAPRNRLHERMPVGGGSPRGETLPRARGHRRRLPQGSSGRPRGEGDAGAARTAPLPPAHPRGDPGADDRPRRVPRAGPVAPRDVVGEDPQESPPETAAVRRRRLFRRAGDEGDLGPLRDGRGGGPRGLRRVRRRAGVPGGGVPVGGDRTDRRGGVGEPYIPAGAVDGGPPVGKASGVGGVERTLSAGPAGGRGGEPSGTGGAPVGALGKYRANISGR